MYVQKSATEFLCFTEFDKKKNSVVVSHESSLPNIPRANAAAKKWQEERIKEKHRHCQGVRLICLPPFTALNLSEEENHQIFVCGGWQNIECTWGQTQNTKTCTITECPPYFSLPFHSANAQWHFPCQRTFLKFLKVKFISCSFLI